MVGYHTIRYGCISFSVRSKRNKFHSVLYICTRAAKLELDTLSEFPSWVFSFNLAVQVEKVNSSLG